MLGLSGSFLSPVWCVRATGSRVQHLAAAAGAARRGLIRSGRRVAPTSLCPPVWGRRGQTRYVRCALSAQTVAASQSTKRALARPTPDGRTQPLRNIAPTGQHLPQQRSDWAFHRWRANTAVGQGVCGQAAARHVRRREAQWPWPRAQRASSSDLSHLFERRERSERKRVVRRATTASIAGESVHRTDRLTQALRPARTRLGTARCNERAHYSVADHRDDLARRR